MAVTSNLYKFVTVLVSEAKRPPGSRSGLKCPLELLESLYIIVFQGGCDGRGYTYMRKTPGGSTFDLPTDFTPLLDPDPDDGFISETAARRF